MNSGYLDKKYVELGIDAVNLTLNGKEPLFQ